MCLSLAACNSGPEATGVPSIPHPEPLPSGHLLGESARDGLFVFQVDDLRCVWAYRNRRLLRKPSSDDRAPSSGEPACAVDLKIRNTSRVSGEFRLRLQRLCIEERPNVPRCYRPYDFLGHPMIRTHLVPMRSSIRGRLVFLIERYPDSARLKIRTVELRVDRMSEGVLFFIVVPD